jgi:hypothetical protein
MCRCAGAGAPAAACPLDGEQPSRSRLHLETHLRLGPACTCSFRVLNTGVVPCATRMVQSLRTDFDALHWPRAPVHAAGRSAARRSAKTTRSSPWTPLTRWRQPCRPLTQLSCRHRSRSHPHRSSVVVSQTKRRSHPRANPGCALFVKGVHVAHSSTLGSHKIMLHMMLGRRHLSRLWPCDVSCAMAQGSGSSVPRTAAPKLGCSKCRYSRGGCGQCRAAHEVTPQASACFFPVVSVEVAGGRRSMSD